MNHTQLYGRLGSDPETRFTSGGQKVTSFRMAVNSRKSGQEETMWWRVTIWGDRFDKMISYLKKGSAVIVFGEMKKPEIYNNREGQPQVSLDITAESLHFSPFGGKNDSNEASQQGQAHTPVSQPASVDEMVGEEEPMPF